MSARAPKRVLAAVLLFAAGEAREAHAAGLYFSDRGVRPMGRAGAFVAGADDLGAIAYNPAGLSDAQTSLLVDVSMLRFSAEYTRQLRIIDADDTVRTIESPTVRGSSPVIPFPTIAGSYAFGDKKQYTIAGGTFAPYPAIATYPETVDGKPSPGRYALGAFDGSALAFVGGFFAYKPVPELRIGVGLGALVGVFQSTVTFSVSPADRLVGAPEQPEFDAQSRFRVGPIFAPTGSAGAIWVPHPMVRFGASFQLPTVISAPATFDVRLPTAAIFDGASVSGRSAHVRFKLPAVIRAGVELRPTDELRVEVAFVRELWSIHDALELTPEGVAIEDVSGLPRRLPIPPIRFARGFKDSNSYRMGGELDFRVWGYSMTVRSGVAYETSAIAPAYLSLLTIDTDKVTLSLGGSVRIGRTGGSTRSTPICSRVAFRLRRIRRASAASIRSRATLPSRRSTADVTARAQTCSGSARCTRSEPNVSRPHPRMGPGMIRSGSMGPLLVVEDDDGARRFLVRFLGSIRPIREAVTRDAAVAQLGAHDDWSGFLIDVSLGSDRHAGLYILDAARRVFPSVPAAVVTASNERDIINRAATLSATFLCKPFGTTELNTFLARVMAAEVGLDERLEGRLHELARRWDLTRRETDILAWLLAGRSRESYMKRNDFSLSAWRAAMGKLLAKAGTTRAADLVLAVFRDEARAIARRR